MMAETPGAAPLPPRIAKRRKRGFLGVAGLRAFAAGAVAFLARSLDLG